MCSERDIPMAAVITPHGFGHAARATAVMAEMSRRHRSIHWHIFTTLPEWFFEDGEIPFTYHSTLVDIGVVQLTPLKEDLEATLKALDNLLPYSSRLVDDLAHQWRELGVELVLSDISPLGWKVAEVADIPAVLVESFTWDWIYQIYLDEEPAFQRWIDWFARVNLEVPYHLQTEPLCVPSPRALATIPPICRANRRSPGEVRRDLEIRDDAVMVLVTIGGVGQEFPFLKELRKFTDYDFVIMGQEGDGVKRDNVLVLPRNSSFFHPDLVKASQVVMGKAGYSTIAEVYQAGVPFGYLLRMKFSESGILDEYIQSTLEGRVVEHEEFYSGKWGELLEDLVHRPRLEGERPCGREETADWLEKIWRGKVEASRPG